MLRPEPIPPVPEETARVARAAFPRGHLYLTVADELGELFTDGSFAPLFPARGQPALAPWRLALATILQFAEGLSDAQAADAVRSRIDWKYVLRLELTDPGFDASVLSEFRTRLVEGEAEQLLLDTLLTWCRARNLLKARGRQRTDSTHVLAAVRALNRLETVGETLRHALDSLAVAAPDWLQGHVPPEWADRYGRRAEDDRLPRHQEARRALARTIGQDGFRLLDAVVSPSAPSWLRQVPAVETLRRVWVQQYQVLDDVVQWRANDNIPPAARMLASPYDLDAHYAVKRTTQWIGYKVCLTETCDDDAPELITNVETTPAPTADGAATPRIHRHLQERGLLPAAHLVDTGFVDAELFVRSRADYDVDLVGPTRRDYHWQAREGTGYAMEHFDIDWDGQRATCPEGHTSISWTPAVDNRTNPVIKIKFSGRDCRPCPARALCTRSQKKYPRRTITVRADADYHALQAARQREATDDFAAVYALRAGIEGTLSRGLRTCGLRRTRYVGQPRAHLGHVLTAVGLNFLRLGEWFAGRPRAKTRRPPFARLMGRRLTV